MSEPLDEIHDALCYYANDNAYWKLVDGNMVDCSPDRDVAQNALNTLREYRKPRKPSKILQGAREAADYVQGKPVQIKQHFFGDPLEGSLNELTKKFPDVKIGLLEDIMQACSQHYEDRVRELEQRAQHAERVMGALYQSLDNCLYAAYEGEPHTRPDSEQLYQEYNRVYGIGRVKPFNTKPSEG